MTKLKIKTESLPQRCEICHQNDEFDPETGVCGRCGDLSAEKLAEPVERLNLLQRAYMRANFLAALTEIRTRSFLERRFRNNGPLRVAFYAFITLSIGLIIGLGMTVLLAIYAAPSIPENTIEKSEYDFTDKDRVFNDKKTDGVESGRDGMGSVSPSVVYMPDQNGIFSETPSDKASDKNGVRHASSEERK